MIPIVLLLVVLALLAWFAEREYHVFGVEMYSLDAAYSAALLIDCPTIHA